MFKFTLIYIIRSFIVGDHKHEGHWKQIFNYYDNLLVCVALFPNCRYGNIADYGLDKGYVLTRKWVNIFIYFFN